MSSNAYTSNVVKVEEKLSIRPRTKRAFSNTWVIESAEALAYFPQANGSVTTRRVRSTLDHAETRFLSYRSAGLLYPKAGGKRPTLADGSTEIVAFTYGRQSKWPSVPGMETTRALEGSMIVQKPATDGEPGSMQSFEWSGDITVEGDVVNGERILTFRTKGKGASNGTPANLHDVRVEIASEDDRRYYKNVPSSEGIPASWNGSCLYLDTYLESPEVYGREKADIGATYWFPADQLIKEA